MWLVLICCSTEQGAGDGEMTFAVDEGLLGDAFRDVSGDFAIRAPAGWTALPDSVLEEAMRIAEQRVEMNPRHLPRMLAMFRHPRHGATLTVSRYRSELSQAERDSLIKFQGDGLYATFPEVNVQSTRFVYQGSQVRQFMVSDPRAVVIKLLVDRLPLPMYQLDYVIPQAVYEKNLNSVESSIGSMRVGTPQ